MKKIERFFEKYAWPLRLAVFVLFCFWVLPGLSLIRGMASSKTYELESDRKAISKLEIYADGIVKQAIAKGQAYGAVEYFDDLRKIHQLRKDISPSEKPLPRPRMAIDQIWKLSFDNIRDGRFTQKDIDLGKKQYYDWLRRHPNYVFDDFDRSETRSESEKELEGKENAGYLKAWIIAAYWRGLLLAFVLYFTRMARGFDAESQEWSHEARAYFNKRRQGIMATILADKLRFIIALMLWPIRLLKYPTNVVREIVVEAELRRLKGLFHKFNPAERLAMREIANGDGYKEWRENLRSRNRFRHAFATALLVTLAFHVLATFASATDKGFVSGASSIVSHDERVEDDTGQDQVPDWVEPALPPFPPLLKKERAQVAEVRTIQAEPDRSIDQIPDFGCFRQVAFNF